MDEGTRKGLELAAEVIARAVRARAATFSRKIPPTVRSFIGRDGAGYVEAGGEAAPNAAMFEIKGSRHPLFGLDHWYTQPHKPFMEEASDEALDRAADAFADAAVEGIAKDNGYR